MSTNEYYFYGKATVRAKDKEEAFLTITSEPERFLDDLELSDWEPSPSIAEEMDDDS